MIFLGCLFDRVQERELQLLTTSGLSNAANTFQWGLIDGLNHNLNIPVSIYNVLPVGVYPKQYKKLILSTRHWSYQGSKNIEVGCINLPFVKQFMRSCIIKNFLKHAKDKQILIYSTYLPFLKAVRKLDPSYQVTLVVTDLPEYYDLGKVSTLRKWFRDWNNRKITACLKRVNAFVLLTEKMKEPLHVGNRPYVVVEGICSINTNLPPNPISKKVILYAGALYYQFGIGTLLQAFSEIIDPNYELWICGAGEAETEIRSRALKDGRIHFYGYVSKEDVWHMQQKATVLVNPRTNDGEYTKYSFPSKTIEYMTSGVPILMYKLDGVPSDYDPYLFYIEGGSSVETLCLRLQEICEMPERVRIQFGIAARDFVVRKKNCARQTDKIIGMIEGLH